MFPIVCATLPIDLTWRIIRKVIMNEKINMSKWWWWQNADSHLFFRHHYMIIILGCTWLIDSCIYLKWVKSSDVKAKHEAVNRLVLVLTPSEFTEISVNLWEETKIHFSGQKKRNQIMQYRLFKFMNLLFNNSCTCGKANSTVCAYIKTVLNKKMYTYI